MLERIPVILKYLHLSPVSLIPYRLKFISFGEVKASAIGVAVGVAMALARTTVISNQIWVV